ncbi:MAG: acetate/propionate family kinase [Pseudomonadales bacterium]|jgi:acetate kinase|nr:acetate/propionate family kinase [Pseudomonadales bacterium]
MRVLVFNLGSSSLKFGIFDSALADNRIFKGEFADFQGEGCTLRYRVGGEHAGEYTRREAAMDLPGAIARVPAVLAEFGYAAFGALGHRVVHGGEWFQGATRIDAEVIARIEQCATLAPLHNPLALLGIRAAMALWPTLPQVAVFDTAFHHSIPDYAHTYAVPTLWRERGLRRYGFHGTSHHYVALRVAEALQRPLAELRLISCHLGNGASVCAISHGRSLDTSMGMTPMEGLVMGTRAGDVDPGIFAFLAREFGLDAAAVEQQLNGASGLYALTGTADLRHIEQRATSGEAQAQLALQLYAYRVRKYIGAYAAAMGGLDAVAFTGGIGENSADMRRRICERLEFLGLYLDGDRNRAPVLDNFAAPAIHALDSRVRVLVTQTNEQYMIAREVGLLLEPLLLEPQLLEPQSPQPNAVQIPVATSARHVHLSQNAVEALFGAGHHLTLERHLSQIEGWAAVETVELIGPKNSFSKVRVLGPVRPQTQIEISHTDTFTLGIDAPLRDSGVLDNTPLIRLRGPAGEITTPGLIVAARHIHLNTSDAERFGLCDGDRVDVKLAQGERAVSFANTLVRVKDTYVSEMHIDTDEANAAGLAQRTWGELLLPPRTPRGRGNQPA